MWGGGAPPPPPIFSPSSCSKSGYWVGGLWGRYDCCLCVTGTEKPVSILGLYCKAFTPAWLGGRPPPSEPPYICRLLAAAGRSWRSFAPPSWVHAIRRYFILLPSLFFFFFFFCFVLLFFSPTDLCNPFWCSSLHIGLCCNATLDLSIRPSLELEVSCTGQILRIFSSIYCWFWLILFFVNEANGTLRNNAIV